MLSLDIRLPPTGFIKRGVRRLETPVTLHGPVALGKRLYGPYCRIFGAKLRRMILKLSVLLLLLVSAFALPAQSLQPAGAVGVPMPAAVLGFTPGDDRKLASWSDVVKYFEQLDRASDRVIFETLGQTTMGKPFVMATISSPANLARLEEYKQIQAQLADPRKLGPPAQRDRKAAELISRRSEERRVGKGWWSRGW